MKITVNINAIDLVHEFSKQEIIDLILEIDNAVADAHFSERLFLSLAESIECEYEQENWSELCNEIINLKTNSNK
jgi:hypothetical protein